MTDVRLTRALLRAVTALLAGAIAAGAAFWLSHLANSPDSYATAYVLTISICAGAVTYLIGTLLADRRFALALRRLGWTATAVPLLIPSTFSFFLPFVAILALTLRPVPTSPAAP